MQAASKNSSGAACSCFFWQWTQRREMSLTHRSRRSHAASYTVSCANCTSSSQWLSSHNAGFLAGVSGWSAASCRRSLERESGAQSGWFVRALCVCRIIQIEVAQSSAARLLLSVFAAWLQNVFAPLVARGGKWKDADCDAHTMESILSFVSSMSRPDFLRATAFAFGVC